MGHETQQPQSNLDSYMFMRRPTTRNAGKIIGGGLLNFYRHVNVTPKCWGWQAAIGDDGYGVFYYRGKQYKAHRFSYMISVADLTPGLEVDHLCKNTRCIRPDHLELVSPIVNNIFRSNSACALNARKTHCKHGHSLSGANLKTNQRRRQCKRCDADRAAAYRQRRKAGALS